MLVAVSVLTFLLLARTFRSIVLPAKAVLLNLISLGAAYGVLVLVWQDGHGSTMIWSNPATGAIATWVPLMVFAFLFGLSMDYEVFLLARMREAYDDGADTAVVTGLSRTGLVDATIVRCLLVPALVSLFGRWNWWLPAPAARVLRVPASPVRDVSAPNTGRDPVAVSS
jgi:RND superfamily putative drug exporter